MDEDGGRVVVVDDKPDVLTAIRLLLKDRVERVFTSRNPATLPQLLQEEKPHVILLDMNFTQDASSGREGMKWLRTIRAMDANVVIIMITAYGDIEKAVRAMKEGAADFITKPWDNERLISAVRNGIKLSRSRAAANARLPDDAATALAEERDYAGIIGESEPMKQVFATIDKVAATDANVLVLGENGTGKELVARALHQLSQRSEGPFVAADLGALSKTLFESELFGHTKGAFTGADRDRTGHMQQAEGGTLFLDEIGNIALSQQAKLLTVLQRREVTPVGSSEPTPIDFRLISATNQPIYDMTGDGSFRQDLLYRINTVEINLPPLRERAGDIPRLARHFVSTFARKYSRPIERIEQAAIDRLQAYPWPGNVRELRHTMERAVIMSEGPSIGAGDLSFSTSPLESPDDELPVEADGLDLASIERAAVRKALSIHGGNISRAANDLGISRKSLYRRIEKYGL